MQQRVIYLRRWQAKLYLKAIILEEKLEKLENVNIHILGKLYFVDAKAWHMEKDLYCIETCRRVKDMKLERFPETIRWMDNMKFN